MMSSVSTHLLQLGDAVLGDPHAAHALELERLGDDADGEDAELLARSRATTGAAPVPVPPPMPAVTNTMCAPGEMIADLVDHLLGGGAADFGLRAGAETLGDLHAHLDDALGLRHA